MSENLVRLVVAGASQSCFSCLDIGSGPGKYRPPVPYWITLDGYQFAPSDLHHQGDLFNILPSMDDKSVDLCMALDVIEHLTKSNGLRLLDHMERIARRRVLVFTPKGFMEQLSPIPWQVHRSGWEPEEFKARGYLTAISDFDYGKGTGVAQALWAVKEIEQ